MARARVSSMRLRKERHTELIALHNCHERASRLLAASPRAPVVEALQVRPLVIALLICVFSVISSHFGARMLLSRGCEGSGTGFRSAGYCYCRLVAPPYSLDDRGLAINLPIY